MESKLFHHQASPPCRAVLLTIKALNLSDLEMVTVNLLEKEQYADAFIKINPHHTVPTLLDDGFSLWDSHAINAYLVDKYGENDGLYPKDLNKRAVINQRLHFDSNILSAHLMAITTSIMKGGAKLVTKDKSDSMIQSYNLLEVLLENKNKYLVGDTITIADFSVLATITSANTLVPLAENRFPKIVEWLGRMQRLPYYEEANLEGLNMFSALMRSKLAR